MVNMNPDDSVEQIANELRAQAVRLWGEKPAPLSLNHLLSKPLGSYGI